MPQLRESEIESFELPSSTPDDKAIVEIDMTITGGVAEDYNMSQDKGAAASRILASAIKSWNFTDKDGQVVPITSETVRRLDVADWGFLAEKFFTKIGVEISAQAVPTDEQKSTDSPAIS